MKIDKIQINNFRAFYGENIFSIEGKNCLIYGENGSGKSSFYMALKMFVESSASQKSTERQFNYTTNDIIKKYIDKDHTEKDKGLLLKNIFSFINVDKEILQEKYADYLQIEKIKDEVSSYDNPKLINCYKIKPFLHYKKIMKIYYFDKVKEELNLFLVFKEILKNYYIQSEAKVLSELTKEKQYQYLNQILNQELLAEINTILNKFHTDINIEQFVFQNQMTLFDEQNHNSIYIKAKYNGAEIDNFHLFFNEARLSALSMSIYFASILKMYEIAGDDVLKILVLDDILVGLDMGNRLSLIKVLNEEFGDFQIFMLTYDKAWYETFRTYRGNDTNWKDYELYKQKIAVENRKFEVPVIFDRTNNENYFERAKNMFDNFEYPSCANYLRKQTEKVLIQDLGIKNLEGIIEMSELKKKYKLLIREMENLNIDNILQDFERDLGRPNVKTGSLFGKINSLKELEEKIKRILSENNFLELNQIKDTILNPLSHHDIEKPIYKEELEKAIEIVKNLKKE